MANKVDQKIDEVTQAHVAECEKLNVSRNVTVTAQRVQEALKGFSTIEILESGYWTSLSDQQRVLAMRDAVVDLAKKLDKPAKTIANEPPAIAVEAEEEPAPVAKKPGRKPKVALA